MAQSLTPEALPTPWTVTPSFAPQALRAEWKTVEADASI